MFKFFANKDLQGNPFLCWIELVILLLIGWFVMSGIFEIKFISYGCITVLVISFMCLRTFTMNGLKTSKQYFILNVNFLSMILYWLWLMKEIIKCALTVSRQVFNGKINPQIVWFKADYDNPAARALLANSITLTPGTVTVDIFSSGIYSVHALDDSAAEGLLDGTMQYKIAKLYGEEIDFKPLKAEAVESAEAAEITMLKPHRYFGKSRTL